MTLDLNHFQAYAMDAESDWPTFSRAVQRRVRAGKIDGVDRDGWTMLTHCARFGSPRTVEYLLDLGASADSKQADIGPTPLLAATKATQNSGMGKSFALTNMSVLLQRGANPDTLSYEGYHNIMWAPLHRAAKEGLEEATQLLVDRGADPMVTCGISDDPSQWQSDFIDPPDKGWTPLHFACFYRRDDSFLSILIEAGGSMQAATEKGLTPEYIREQQSR